MEGAALDWAAAKFFDVPYPVVLDEHNEEVKVSPTTDWLLAGQIIAANKINIQFCRDLRDSHRSYVHAEMDTHSFHGYSKGHDTPLVAVMRCFVASKAFSDSIEVPSDLMGSEINQKKGMKP